MAVLTQAFGISLLELFADTKLREYARTNNFTALLLGSAGYVGIVAMFVASLRSSSLLALNSAWDGTNALLNAVYSYYVLGERFDSSTQYGGVALIVAGLYLIKGSD